VKRTSPCTSPKNSSAIVLSGGTASTRSIVLMMCSQSDAHGSFLRATLAPAAFLITPAPLSALTTTTTAANPTFLAVIGCLPVANLLTRCARCERALLRRYGVSQEPQPHPRRVMNSLKPTKTSPGERMVSFILGRCLHFKEQEHQPVLDSGHRVGT
jgi:hypothetical protein